MLEAQAHRGPDGAGLASYGPQSNWEAQYGSTVSDLGMQHSHRGARCLLGHNLLATQDRADRARQPMIEADVGLVFNGEIYNFPELRRSIEARSGSVFRTDCDTEVLHAMWRCNGISSLEHLRGMFAFAVFEPRDGALWLVRDPFGIKPLYYASNEKGLWFASEIRAFHFAQIVRRVIRDDAAVA